jgi:hypothetical protein
MNKDEPRPAHRHVKLPTSVATSDNPLTESRSRAEQTVLKIARLIGRQIAREEFARRRNLPGHG